MNDSAQQNQNSQNPLPDVNQPAVSAANPPTPQEPAAPVFTTVEDVPPQPQQPVAQPTPQANAQTVNMGAGAGPQDEQIPSLANNYYTPKPGGVNRRMITGLLGVLVLTLAVGVGTFLALNNQNPQKKAGFDSCPDGSPITWCAVFTCPNGDTSGDGECNVDDQGASYTTASGNGCSAPSCGQADFYKGAQGDWDSYCNHEFSANWPNCSGGGNGEGEGEGPNEWCEDVTVAKGGERLSNAQLKQLQPGEEITLRIKGGPNENDFDRARFSVNGGERQATREQNNNGTFKLQYVIPEGVTEFNIRGAVHKESNDRWVNKQRDGVSECNIDFRLDGASGSPSPTPTTPPGESPSPTPTTPPNPETAQCLEIKIYDSEWNQLSATDLTSLQAGDTIRVSVAGDPSSGFDMARFTINGALRAEITQQKPNTTEYYDEYTLPTDVSTFSVNAQLHHTVLGWI